MNIDRSSFRNNVTRSTVIGLALLGAGLAAAQDVGTVETELKISQLSGGFSGDLDGDDLFGGSVAVAGDLDGDGRSDLLVGAPRDDDGVSQAGALWVLFLDASGAVRATSKISATQGGLGAPLYENDHFGTSVAALGDVDGDGVPDAAVGIPGSDVGAPQAGLVLVLFLRDDGSVKSSRAIGSGTGGFTGLLLSNDDFGVAVAGLGDLDGDGIPDLAVGADGDDSGQPQAGSAWVLFLNADGTVRDGSKLAAGLGGFGGVLDSNDYFGSALARVGDLDGDGLVELAVGAPGDDEGGSDAGAVWILHVGPDGLTQGQGRIASDGLPTAVAAGDRFGRALAATGDLDGDGRDDLAAGLPGADEGGLDRGALRLLFLAADASVASETVISGLQGGFGGTLDDGDEFGIAVSASPVDATTGHARVFAGAWRDDDGASNSGATWMLELQGTAGSQPFVPLIESLAGRAGQPALLVPPPSGADDFIGEPVVVVPMDVSNVSLESVNFNDFEEIGFSSNATYEAGDVPVLVTAADFTSDSQPDILAANFGSDSISLLVQQSTVADGSGGGGFAPKIDFTLPFDDHPISVRAGDLDGDGALDVLVAGDGGLTTFLGDGQGTLVPVGFAPVALLSDLGLGDLDGDGDLDVVAASGAPAAGPGAEAGFATSLRNDGSGGFVEHASFATGKAVASVLVSDFDGGGAPDALLAVHELDGGPGGVPQGRIDLWVGDGGGGFSPSTVFAGLAQPNPDGIHPRWGSVADVNGDGRPDAMYTSTDSLALPLESLVQEQPPVSLTLLLSVPGGGFATSSIATAYAGKGVAPLLHDIAPPKGDGAADCILIWTQDELAGAVDGPAASTQPVTFLAALVGDGLGGFTDASPNQFLGADEPGDPALADVGTGTGDEGGGLDVLIPDLATRSLNVFLGDGQGGVGGKVVVPDVDPIDVDALPAGGIWQGGPRTVVALDLDGDGLNDVAIYSQWDDLAGLFGSQAAFVTRFGDGTGHFAGGEDVLMPRAGELAGGDVGGDGSADIAVTQRSGGGGDSVAIFAAGSGGQLVFPPQSVFMPAGVELTGGLELADVDGAPGDEILTTGQQGGIGSLVVISKVAGVFVVRSNPLDVPWDSVRSLTVGPIDGDAQADVAIGVADGSLVLARGTGQGAFQPLVTGATPAALGGGALRLVQIDGDGKLDLVSSNASDEGLLDQAFVRELFGTGNGAFGVVTLPGVSSVGVNGALRPAVGDLDDDGAMDLVLAHGGSGNVSLLINQLNTFLAFGEGKAGSGGLVPSLKGKGYTTLGGTITIDVQNALGGAAALLWVGFGPLPDQPYPAMETIAGEVVLFLGGATGVPGAGNVSITTHLPNIERFAGLELVLQTVVVDPGATGPGPKLAFSNGLSFTIVP